MSTLDNPLNTFRNKIRRMLSCDPRLPWGGLVTCIDTIPQGLEITAAAAEGDGRRRTRVFRVTIEEVME